jgi:hypothetical protein
LLAPYSKEAVLAGWYVTIVAPPLIATDFAGDLSIIIDAGREVNIWIATWVGLTVLMENESDAASASKFRNTTPPSASICILPSRSIAVRLGPIVTLYR